MTARRAVSEETGTTAACSKVRPAGLWTSLSARAAAYSANEPRLMPKTSSPTAKPVDRRADGDDRAGHVEPGHRVLRSAEAEREAHSVGRAGHQVPGAAVEPGRVLPDEDLVVARSRGRDPVEAACGRRRRSAPARSPAWCRAPRDGGGLGGGLRLGAMVVSILWSPRPYLVREPYLTKYEMLESGITMTRTDSDAPSTRATEPRTRAARGDRRSPTRAGSARSPSARWPQALGVKPMSVYHHVANKEQILDGIVDIVFGEIELPSPDGEWRDRDPPPFGVGPAGPAPAPVGHRPAGVAHHTRARRRCATTTPTSPPARRRASRWR